MFYGDIVCYKIPGNLILKPGVEAKGSILWLQFYIDIARGLARFYFKLRRCWAFVLRGFKYIKLSIVTAFVRPNFTKENKRISAKVDRLTGHNDRSAQLGHGDSEQGNYSLSLFEISL